MNLRNKEASTPQFSPFSKNASSILKLYIQISKPGLKNRKSKELSLMQTPTSNLSLVSPKNKSYLSSLTENRAEDSKKLSKHYSHKQLEHIQVNKYSHFLFAMLPTQILYPNYAVPILSPKLASNAEIFLDKNSNNFPSKKNNNQDLNKKIFSQVGIGQVLVPVQFFYPQIEMREAPKKNLFKKISPAKRVGRIDNENIEESKTKEKNSNKSNILHNVGSPRNKYKLNKSTLNETILKNKDNEKSIRIPDPLEKRNDVLLDPNLYNEDLEAEKLQNEIKELSKRQEKNFIVKSNKKQ